MVPYPTILSSNSSLKITTPNPTAIFIGATAGIGHAALLSLTAHTRTPKIYILGRSPPTLATLLTTLTTLNPHGTYHPIPCDDLTLLSNVDRACAAIRSHETSDGHVDLLIMSMGYVTFAGRTESAEGLDRWLAVRYYARMRFVVNLLPLLNRAREPRVVSVLAAGMEGRLSEGDFGLRGKGNYSIGKVGGASAGMTTLFFEEVRRANPKVGFVHTFPGAVDTGLGDRAEYLGGVMKWVVKWLLMPWVRLFGYSVEEAGERVVFAATSGRFRGGAGGDVGEEVEVGSDGQRGSGVFLLAADSSAMEGSKVVKEMREKGVGQKVLDHTMGEFERIANANANANQ